MYNRDVRSFLSPLKGSEGPSNVGSDGRGFSRLDSDADRRMPPSSGRSIAMTGLSASLDNDAFRSRSLVIDRRTEPKLEKGLFEGGVDTDAESWVAFLLGPNGNSERRVRNAGMPEPAGVVGVVDGPGEKPIPWVVWGLRPGATLLVDGLRELVDEKTPFFIWVGIDDGVLGERWFAIAGLYYLESSSGYSRWRWWLRRRGGEHVQQCQRLKSAQQTSRWTLLVKEKVSKERELESARNRKDPACADPNVKRVR